MKRKENQKYKITNEPEKLQFQLQNAYKENNF